MSPVKIKDSDPNYFKLGMKFKAYAGHNLTVGIRKGQIATYAAAHEYGTRILKSRPFFSTAIDNNVEKYLNQLMNRHGQVLAGKLTPAASLALLGIEVRNDLIKSIQSGEWESLSLRYAEWKRRHGKSEKPLVLHGHMQQAISHKIGRGGDED